MFIDSPTDSPTDSMTAGMTAPATAYLDTLAQAAIALQDPSGQQARPPAKAMVQALVQAEIAAKQQRLSYPLAALTGTWRLCFSTNRGAHQKSGAILGRGFYMPWFSPAYISFVPQVAEPDSSGTGAIGNQIQMGPVRLKLTGLFRYPNKKNLLAFDFGQMQIFAFGQSVYRGNVRAGKNLAATFDQQAIAQLPFFAFFLVTDNLIAARGRGGGLAMWVRSDPA